MEKDLGFGSVVSGAGNYVSGAGGACLKSFWHMLWKSLIKIQEYVVCVCGQLDVLFL